MKSIFTYTFLSFLILSCFRGFSQDTSAGKIAYYPFNGNANDEVGNIDGIVFDATLAEDRFGNPNNAYYFNGLTSFIEIPHSPVLNFGSEENFTISLWIQIDNEQKDMEGTNSGIISKWNEHTSYSYPFAIRYWNINESSSREERIFSLRYDSQSCGNNPIITSECKITRDEWHHIVLIKNEKTISYYQDGTFQGSIQDTTTPTCDTKNNHPILLGKRKGDQRYFTGLIDDIVFYNRAITSEEIYLLLYEKNWKPKMLASEADILSFSLPEEVKPPVINNETKTVEIEVPCSSDITNLVASFRTSNEAIAVVNNIRQKTGITANNFSQPVTYQIVSAGGCNTNLWTVRVVKEKSSTEDQALIFNTFTINGQIGESIIDYRTNNIQVEMPCGSSLTSLTPRFDVFEGSVVSVQEAIQTSGSSQNNFSDTVFYQVGNSESCSTREWGVIVVEKPLENIDFTQKEFFIPNIITPNNDNLNDTFQIGERLQNSSLTIYNRYGRRVYYSNSYLNDFDGNKISSGIYFYTITNPCIAPLIKGHIHVFKNQ